MDDRTMLEMAAKAAGLKVDVEASSESGRGLYLDDRHMTLWNPRVDRGQALELAVKLRLCLYLELPRIGIGPMLDGPELYVDEGDDEMEQVCLAITLAAATAGKAMP